MTVAAWLSLAVLLGAVLVTAVALIKLLRKNKKLEDKLSLLSKQLKLLQESQLGLGKHLLAIEARQQHAKNTGPEAPGQPPGTLNLIATRLREGRDGASISAELGVSASEIHLVEMVLRQTADQAGEQMVES